MIENFYLFNTLWYFWNRSDYNDGYQKKNVLPTDVSDEYDDSMYSRYFKLKCFEFFWHCVVWTSTNAWIFSFEILTLQNRQSSTLRPSRSSNAIPPLNTKTRYYYKTHQSATVSLPSHQRGSRVHVSPDESETRSYVTKIDTTNIGSPRGHARRPREQDDDDYQGADTKPFFRTGKSLFKNNFNMQSFNEKTSMQANCA